jgi:hypothetical protein
LGEFSPIGRLFAPCSFLKITKIAQILGLLFNGKSDVDINIVKNVLGHRLGYFFTSSSGHPAHSLIYDNKYEQV